MKLYHLLFIVVLLFFCQKQTNNAANSNDSFTICAMDLEKVNIFQIKIEFFKEAYIDVFRQNENILHLGKEGSYVLFFTKPSYDREDMETFFAKAKIDKYEIVRMEVSERNPDLFKK